MSKIFSQELLEKAGLPLPQVIKDIEEIIANINQTKISSIENNQ